MSKKIKLMAVVFVAVLFCVVSSQAALIELGLPTTVNPGPGSLLIDVFLTDAQGVADIDGFNLWIGATGTGANSLIADPNGSTLPGYIFPSSFAYFITPTSPLEVAVTGSAMTGTTGVVPGLLAQLTFNYAGNIGDIYTFSLVDPSQNFGSSASGPDFPLILTGNTMILPIPSAIWLLGSSLLVLMGARRMKKEMMRRLLVGSLAMVR